MKMIGYARVSTSGQTLDAQLEQPGAAGCDPVFKETMSGARSDRPELKKALATLPEEDVDLSRFDAAPLMAFVQQGRWTVRLKRTDELGKDAVRIGLPSGLTRKQAADDPGVGMSTLNKWITAHRDSDVVSKEDLSLSQENDRLRRENRILKQEREISKEATQFFAGQKP